MNILSYLKERRAESACIAGILYIMVAGSNYLDMPAWAKNVQTGRTKNSIATVVAGIVGQKMYGDSSIDLNVEKMYYPDSKITGTTYPDYINTHMDLLFTSVDFKAKTKPKLEGEVDKSEFNWGVKEVSPNRYLIERFGPKFNAYLNLDVKEGKISGVFERPGPSFDWDINGTYDTNGNVKCEIDGPVNLGITLEGKITPK